MGSDKVIEYNKEDFTRNGEKYDVIFDTVAYAPMARSFRSLKKKGYFLHCVSTPGVTLRMKILSLLSGKKSVGGGPKPVVEGLLELKEWVEAGKLRTVIEKTLPLEHIVEAHRHVDSGRKKGNLVIEVQKD